MGIIKACCMKLDTCKELRFQEKDIDSEEHGKSWIGEKKDANDVITVLIYEVLKKSFNSFGICIGKDRIMNISQRYVKVCE